ncbi:hypothetical protein V1525DRAFT_403411 [Lipomyces kononenkoae]|uniref:Uncharacterized protein n=1 Tax=Lipomyces kononenkoae TaxID=34357 RepID=A0ACC3T2L2_LIPKO
MSRPVNPWLASKGLLYDVVFQAADRRSDVQLLQQHEESARIATADWELVTGWMMPQTMLHSPGSTVMDAAVRLRQQNLMDRLLNWYIDVVRSHFVLHGLPAIKNPNIPGILSDLYSVGNGVKRVLATLCDASRHYLFPIPFLYVDDTHKVDRLARTRFRHSLNAMIDIALSDHEFQLMAHMLVEHHLAACGKQDENEMVDDQGEAHRLALLAAIREQIDLLEVQDRMERIVAEVYHKFMPRYISQKYARIWEQEQSVEPLMVELKNLIYGPISRCISALIRRDEFLEARLYEFATECLVKLGVEEMFDIVIYFPDSTPALGYLKTCMRTQEHRAQLVAAFQNACQARLLHCGANTSDIISFYMSTIRAFKLLEPRGVLLDKVSRSIRRYLRDREDTVKCIVNGMLEVEDANTGDLSELSKELASASSTQSAGSVDDNDYSDMNWVPDPVDAAPDFRNKRSSDFIGSLLSLYDNKEVFVKEIVVVMANRLLDLQNYEIEREMMHLELLKVLFGEADLHNCDVMVKDILESKRADANIHDPTTVAAGTYPVADIVHASMVSKLFWPAFRDEDLALPPFIEAQLDRYSAKFSILKSARKLSWLKRLGSVDVTLELEDRTLDFTVSPDRASLIYLFQERPTYTLDELKARLNMDETATRRAVGFWIKNDVLKEDETCSDRYILLERAEQTKKKVLLDDAAESSVQTAEEKATEEMRIYWSYINGMLTNIPALPIDRIQSFLKMLIPKEVGYSRNLDELRDFLTVMVAEEKLECVSGNYRLKK